MGGREARPEPFPGVARSTSWGASSRDINKQCSEQRIEQRNVGLDIGRVQASAPLSGFGFGVHFTGKTHT